MLVDDVDDFVDYDVGVDDVDDFVDNDVGVGVDDVDDVVDYDVGVADVDDFDDVGVDDVDNVVDYDVGVDDVDDFVGVGVDDVGVEDVYTELLEAGVLMPLDTKETITFKPSHLKKQKLYVIFFFDIMKLDLRYKFNQLK